MPPALSSDLEKGLEIIEDPNNPTSPETDNCTITSCVQGNQPPRSPGLWVVPRIRKYIGSLRWPRFLSKQNGLQIDGAMGTTAIPKLEDYPKGFPRVSCFLDSDESFMLFRRFGIVFSRLLLNKQDEIRQMEDELQGMDRMDQFLATTKGSGNENYLLSRDEDVNREPSSIPACWSMTRPQLLEKLETKVLEYSELLLKANQLKALDKPASRDYRSVLHYMENDGGQMFENEMSWIYDKEDLVSLRPGREHAWLDGMLERLLKYIFCTPVRLHFPRLLTPPPRPPKKADDVQETNARTENPAIHYYDRRRIAKCVTFLITILILILLMIPIWLLYKSSVNGTIGTTNDTIVMILSFTLIFSAALSVFTKAKRHEIVAASAGGRQSNIFTATTLSEIDVLGRLKQDDERILDWTKLGQGLLQYASARAWQGKI
ncbi:MAG: hypothetical protein Q9221_005608 [Calogaya cf. arnoldii]